MMGAMLQENLLEIRLPEGASGRRFDGEEHRLSHCMKAVDFIVDLPDRLYFIEVKDPDQSANETRRLAYAKRLKSGEIDIDLKVKFRDTWMYEWAEHRISKPVFYLVLLAFEQLTAAELQARKSGIEKQLPLNGPDGRPWQRSFASGCAVFNIAAWNRSFPNMPVRRLV